MQIETSTDVIAAPPVSPNGGAWQIISFTSLSFVVYLAIGLPLAILPEYVHMRMGYHASLAGLVISIQYIATFLSRPWAGRISDRKGAKISVLWGMGACTLSGMLLLAAAALHRNPAWLSFTSLIASRLVLGVGESLGSTGATLWGISSAGPEHTAKVISYNGVSTYGALALGAPLGVVMETHWGLTSVAILTIIICAIAYVWAALKPSVPVVPGEHLPFRSVLGRVMPHGAGLALGGVGYSALATFVTLFYASRRWDGAALCLTAFGFAFIATRLLFIRHHRDFRRILRHEGMSRNRILWRAPSVAFRFPLDGTRRRRTGGCWIFARLPGSRRRSRRTRAGGESRHSPERLHRLCRRLILHGWPHCRRSNRSLRIRQRFSLRLDLRIGCSRHRPRPGQEKIVPHPRSRRLVAR